MSRVRRVSDSVVEAARAMRHAPTAAEEALWRVLRDRKRAGVKFRRQHPIGRFVLDFYSPELKLVVEVDGAHHDLDRDRDEARTAFLASGGYRVLRFRNAEVMEDPARLLRSLHRAIDLCRTVPNPLPELGEGGEPKRAG
jgi:very-short-patch-repair endonuclease